MIGEEVSEHRIAGGFVVRMTGARREKTIQRYRQQLASMLAEILEWYPARVPESCRKRLASLAAELGYNSYRELLLHEGFNIEPDRRAAARPAPGRIEVENAIPSIIEQVGAKVAEAVGKVDGWYPDGVVKDLRKQHTKFAENLTKAAKNLGYEGWADLLTDYGYTVEGGGKVGRQKTNDLDELLETLKSRYEGKPPADNVSQVRDDNPDIAGQIKSMQNGAHEHFGKSLNEVLAECGILPAGSRGRTRHGPESDEELTAIFDTLVEKYSNIDRKPATLSELWKYNPEVSAAEGHLRSRSPELFGGTLVRALKERGVLRSPAKPVDESFGAEEAEALLGEIRSRYQGRVREPSLRLFEDANPDYRAHRIEVKRYLSTLGKTAKEYLTENGLISKTAREDSVPRPDQKTIDEFYERIEVVDKHDLKRRIPNSAKWFEFDSSVIGSETYGSAQAHEMLRTGDSVELYVNEDGYVFVAFCGNDLGLINMDDRIRYRLASRVKHADANGVLGGRIHASVWDVAGGPKRPKALLKVYFAEDESAQSIINGLLISKDGKTLLECLTPSDNLSIPDGVERIDDRALYGVPVRTVSLPGTLKAIGNEALAYTCVEKIRLPASLEAVGCAAFSYEMPREGRSYHSTDGPVFVEVDPECDRYFSKDGSLVERTDNGGQRLLSFYYKDALKCIDSSRGRKFDIRIPQGVTCLATGCIATPWLFYDFKIYLPESLVRIEEGALPNAYVSFLYIPANLSEVAHDFWRYVAEDLPYIYDDTYNCSGEPLSVFDVGQTKVEINPANKNYSIKNKKFYIANMPEADSGGIPSDAVPRPSDSEVEQFSSALTNAQVSGQEAKKVTYEVVAKVTGNARRAFFMLREGDILEVRASNKPHVAEAFFCGTNVGELEINTRYTDYPFDFLLQGHGIAEEPIDRYEFSRESTGKTLDYVFEFPETKDDDEDEARFYAHASPSGAGSLRKEYWSYKNREALEEERPKLRDVLNGYADFGGIGKPYGIVTTLLGTKTNPSFELVVNFAFKG